MKVDEDDGREGRGLLVKKLIEGGITEEDKLADSCLNFLTAGRLISFQGSISTQNADLC